MRGSCFDTISCHASRIPAFPAVPRTVFISHLAALRQARHRTLPFRKPFSDYNRVAFETSLERWERVASGWPLILDSCCGVGESSIALARAFPDHYVIGVDQSESRLMRHIAGKSGGLPDNLDLVRADLVDFWRLLRRGQSPPVRHYLLYPNPGRKIGHLSQR